MNLYRRKGIFKSRNNNNSNSCLSHRKKLCIINVDSFNQYSKKEIYPNNNLLTVGNVNPTKLRLSLNPSHSQIKNLTKFHLEIIVIK